MTDYHIGYIVGGIMGLLIGNSLARFYYWARKDRARKKARDTDGYG